MPSSVEMGMLSPRAPLVERPQRNQNSASLLRSLPRAGDTDLWTKYVEGCQRAMLAGRSRVREMASRVRSGVWGVKSCGRTSGTGGCETVLDVRYVGFCFPWTAVWQFRTQECQVSENRSHVHSLGIGCGGGHRGGVGPSRERDSD